MLTESLKIPTYCVSGPLKTLTDVVISSGVLGADKVAVRHGSYTTILKVVEAVMVGNSIEAPISVTVYVPI